MSDVYFTILSPLPLGRQQDGRRLFGLWTEYARTFMPDIWRNREPEWQCFSPDGISDFLRQWEPHPLFRRVASPKLESRVWFGGAPFELHGQWTIWLEKFHDFEQGSFSKLLDASAVAFSADLGVIHRVTEAETAKGLENGTVSFEDVTSRINKFLMLSTGCLERFLPDIYWTTVFGKPYIELFSRQRLLSCPAHRVKELENGSIVIQLTPTLQDTATDEAAFERVREAARNHLGADAFFDLAKGLDHKYRVPVFEWGPVLH